MNAQVHEFTVEGDFGSRTVKYLGRFRDDLDIDYAYDETRMQAARESLTAKYNQYEAARWESANKLAERYTGGDKLERDAVSPMLFTLTQLTAGKKMGTEFFPYTDPSTEGWDGERVKRVTVNLEEEPGRTMYARKTLCDHLRLAEDGPTNPRAAALATVLERHWGLSPSQPQEKK